MWNRLRQLLGSSDEQNLAPELESEILRAHEDHPNLGDKGLRKVLRDRGLQVSQRQLKRFLRARGIRHEGDDNTPPPSSSLPPVA